MRTWSLTPFNDELDLLEIRLAELDPVVDIHVIAESTVTFSGLPKPLNFADHRDRFRPWLHKIRYEVVDDAPTGRALPVVTPARMLTACASGHWERENHQRDALLRGCTDLDDEDVVLLSDLDELPRADVVDRCRGLVTGTHGRIVKPALQLNMYHLNWRWLMPCVVVCRFMTGRTFRDLGPEQARQTPGEALGPFDPGRANGWHPCYLGGVEGVRRKLAAAAHHELDRSPFNTVPWIENCLETAGDLFGRHRPMVNVAHAELPLYVRHHPDKFRHLMGPVLPEPPPEEQLRMAGSWTW